MRTHQQCPFLLEQGLLQVVGAGHLDVERVEAVVEQVHPVVDGAGEAEDMPVAVAPARGPPERARQIDLAGPARLGGEEGEIERDAMQHQTAQAAAEGQRNPDHQLEDGGVAALLLTHPPGPDAGVHLGGGTRLPEATARPSQLTRKAMAPRADTSSAKCSVSPGPQGLRNLA